jgi:hypothetical protein
VNVALGSSCTNGYRIANNNLTAAGGTSFDSQIFGGMLALIEQKIGARIGNANPTIYALANNSTYYTPGATVLTNSNVVFNDVTAGNNQMTCTTGTPNCPTGGSIGYTTASGYDLASGWGSVNLYNLANAWKSVAPLGSGSNGTTTSATSLTASPGSVAAGASVTLTATVTGSAGTPTGTIQFLVNGAIVGSGTLNASGIATYTYATSCSNLAQLALPKLVPSHEDRQYASVGLGGSKGRSSGNFSWFGAGSGASVACLLLFILPRKRRLAALYLAIASIAIVGGASGCSGGGTVVPLSSSSTNSRNTTLILSASYSGNATYAGSIASGISAAGLTTSTSQVTPVNVTVTPGTCP